MCVFVCVLFCAGVASHVLLFPSCFSSVVLFYFFNIMLALVMHRLVNAVFKHLFLYVCA